MPDGIGALFISISGGIIGAFIGVLIGILAVVIIWTDLNFGKGMIMPDIFSVSFYLSNPIYLLIMIIFVFLGLVAGLALGVKNLG